MRWELATAGPSVTVRADGLSAEHSTSAWGSVFGDTVLSTGVYDIEVGTECVDNASLFVGVAEPEYATEVMNQSDGELLPRDSPRAIVMHGDGRLFIRGVEKDWGLMRLKTGDPLNLTLDFERGIVTFTLRRMVRGKEKETIAEIPSLFKDGCTLVACFGGRDQALAITHCTPRSTSAEGSDESAFSGRRVRDIFTEAMGERVVPVAFQSPEKASSCSVLEASNRSRRHGGPLRHGLAVRLASRLFALCALLTANRRWTYALDSRLDFCPCALTKTQTSSRSSTWLPPWKAACDTDITPTVT